MDVGHLITLVLAAGGALTAAIGVMYRTIMELNKEQAKIREELGEMRGKTTASSIYQKMFCKPSTML